VRSRLERLDELTKQLQAAALDNDATTDIIEELEELRGYPGPGSICTSGRGACWSPSILGRLVDVRMMSLMSW
jgi:hypothetical protein